MHHFSVGQKWVATDPVFGTFFGEVIEIADQGREGIVIITDDKGNVVDTFSGTAAEFQASGDWQLTESGPIQESRCKGHLVPPDLS